MLPQQLWAKELADAIAYCIEAHAHHTNEPADATRHWDGKTPYAIHPIWCAVTLLTETTLPLQVRSVGYRALLFHDLLEDTSVRLPNGTPPEVEALVKEMSFESLRDEMVKVWERSPTVRLLKLYDKVSNLLDSGWMSSGGRTALIEYTVRLREDVRREFGNLNVVRMAESICESLS